MDFVTMSEQAEADTTPPPIVEVEPTGADQTPPDTQEEGPDTDEGGVVVSIGDESPPSEEEESARAPEWVRELRQNHRKLQSENKQLKAQLSGAAEQNKPQPIPKKPTLEDCDYDAELFETRLIAWQDQLRETKVREDKERAAAEQAEKSWNDRLDAYGKAKQELKVRDFDDAEHQILENFSDMQQGLVVKYATAPALVVYAIGKNPAKVKELAAITDPVLFAIALRDIEKAITVTNRKQPPQPESKVTSSGRISGGVDSTLERLRVEAEKTGDYSNVTAYKKQQRKAKS